MTAKMIASIPYEVPARPTRLAAIGIGRTRNRITLQLMGHTTALTPLQAQQIADALIDAVEADRGGAA